MKDNAAVFRTRTIALDMIAFVLLAAATGLASGITLACVALLFAAPANAAVPGEGALLLKAMHGEGAVRAPLLSTNVHFRVSGLVARARVKQTFSNPLPDWYEGVYVFPLPENAAVDRMRMRIGTRIVEAEVRERGEARRIHDQARASGQRSALLDQQRANVFTTRVANIGPRESIVIEIEYQQTLRYADGRFSLRFPMVVGPRYILGAQHVAGATDEGWSRNTDRVPDAARITPPVLRPDDPSAPANPVSIRVELDAGVPLERIESPYHRVSVEAPDATHRVISLADGPVPANRDFELVWVPRQSAVPQVAWFTETDAGRHYGMLMIMPPGIAHAAARLPREVIFVLDTSGSMAGASIRQAKNALGLALARLTSADRFNVIEFNSSARAVFDAAKDASAANVARAREWVGALDARGGTQMASALALALDARDNHDRLRQVVFLTDGAIGNGEELFRLIRSRLGASRLFTIGIGSAPNGHFMTTAASIGRGTYTYIGRIDEVASRMGTLFAKLENPVMKGLTVRWPEGSKAESWPARIPDLYAGEPVVLSVALATLEGVARVSGARAGRVWEARVPLGTGSAGTGVGTIWAREKVSSLLDSLRDGAAEADVRTRVIALASAHRLVTRYTSFVAVDRSPARTDANGIWTTAVPTLMPQGWKHDKVFGELPRGATDSRYALSSGLALLVAAALLFAALRRRRTA